MSGQRVQSSFSPPWWLRNPHAQTLWGAMFRGSFDNVLREERLPTPDGDFLRLFWSTTPHAPDGPLIVMMHGLAGSVESPYLQGLYQAFATCQVEAVTFQLRGSGLVPNATARSYHSGSIDDFEHVLTTLRGRYPHRPLRSVGVSLSGNLMLLHLGLRGADSLLDRAVAICPPMDLHRCNQRMSRGVSVLYQQHLLRLLQEAVGRKRAIVEAAGYDVDAILASRSFREFDDRFTAPLHGFRDADHYYTDASSQPVLGNVQVPTWILTSEDDPFMYPDITPPASAVSDAVTLEVADRGGHVGFVEGFNRYWLDRRVPEILLP